ncbi:MAG TPA: hypothetical protein VGA37_10810 [Gemmatimonadales bacterium]
MNELYVVGGRQRRGTDVERVREWHHYGCAVILRLDLRSGSGAVEVEYQSPPEVCPADRPSFVFKAGSLDGDTLHVCTQTELLAYTVPTFQRTRYVSLPCLNDVHFVGPGDDGAMLVANTGLDMVLEVSAEGTVLREWAVTEEEPWSRFSRHVDYRKVPSTKPHISHPNHVFRLGESIWATRCHQGDAVCLTGPGRIERIADTYIHDGLLRDGVLYFTSVDGFVITVDPASHRIISRVDLNAIARPGHPLGWCRGIALLDERHVAVGFSRLRATRWKESVRWFRDRVTGSDAQRPLATRVVVFDLVSQSVVGEYPVEANGVNAIFSLHVAAPS